MEHKTVFDKTELGRLKLKNRLIRSATGVGLCEDDGAPKDAVLAIYRELACGGSAALVTESIDVSGARGTDDGRMKMGDKALDKPYTRLVDAVHEGGARFIAQLSWGAHKDPGSTDPGFEPETFALEDLDAITTLFSKAARQAKRCGFDGVQIDVAYDGLLQSFLNPGLNRRQDEFGGDVEGRMKLCCDILDAIVDRDLGISLSVKLGFYKDDQDEFALEDCVSAAAVLQGHGIDFIEVVGNHSPQELGNTHASCYSHLACAVAERVDVPVVSTGKNIKLDVMGELANQADIAAFGISRALIRQPDLVSSWMANPHTRTDCVSCDRCYRLEGKRCQFLMRSAWKANRRRRKMP